MTEQLKREIFKMQRPLIGEEILIYNIDKSYVGKAKPDDDWMKLFGNNIKIYVEGFIDENRKLNVVHISDGEEW